MIFLLELIFVVLMIYSVFRYRRVKKSAGVMAKVVNTQRGALFCYVSFELSDGKRVNLQVPGASFAGYVVGDKGTLKYYKDTFHSFERINYE